VTGPAPRSSAAQHAKSFPKIRALLVTSNFWPERTGIGQVNTEFARFLARKGVEVDVVAAHPYYPEWRVYDGYRTRLSVTERLDGIRIRRSWHYTAPSPGAGARMLHEFTLALFAIPNLIRALSRPGKVFIVSPDLSFAFFASILARAMGRPYSLVVQDVMPDAAMELGMLRNRWIIHLSKMMARSLYNGADEIRTLGEGMRRRIAAATRSSARISVIPNAINVQELSPRDGSGELFRKRFVPEGVFSVVHSGNIGQKQDLAVLVRAAVELKDHKDIHFYVFGDGAAKEDFLYQVAQQGAVNISHFPFQDREMVPHMMYGAGAVLISQLPEVIDIVVPSKLQVAMASGAMIIASCAAESETAQIVEASGGGVVVPPSDGHALAAEILKVKNGSIDSAAFRSRAQTYAREHFNEELLYGTLARELFASSGSRSDSLEYSVASE
jgi:colanic acid biosynthesis glycosyl transferase WcaI